MTQTVRGVIVDKILQTSLPGAQVVIAGSNPLIGVATDENGVFRIPNVPVGRQTIQISLMGYLPVALVNIQVLSSKELYLTIEMEEDVRLIDEVVVTVGRQTLLNDNVLGSAQSIRPEEANRFAGARQDPSRMASNYAGVVGGGDQRNDVIVRGNSPNGILWRLEDTDIPAPNHFSVAGNPGGVFSILNNNLLASSDFITGAFPAEYGNRTAGVFDLRMRKGNNENTEHTFQAGLNGLELGTEGPLGKDGGSYLVNGRYFYTGILSALGADLGASGIPKFWDGAFKINLPTKRSGVFTVWAIGGDSDIANKESSEDIADWDSDPVEDDNFGSFMVASGVSHSMLYSEKTLGKFIMGYSANGSTNQKEFVYADGTVSPGEIFHFDEQYISFRYVVDHKVSKNLSLHGGLEHKRISYSYSMKEWETRDAEPVTPLNENGSQGFNSTAFYQFNWRPTERWQVVGGVHGMVVHSNMSKAIEPRLAILYAVNNDHRLHFSYGKHSQMHPLLYYRWQTPDTQGNFQRTNIDLDLTRAHHYVAGYDWSINENLHFKSELYYQALYDIPVSSNAAEEYYSFANLGADFSFEGKGNIINRGKGYNQGWEVTLERFFNKDFYLLFTSSVFDSKYKSLSGKWFNTAFNSNYAFNFLSGKEWSLNSDGTKTLSADLRTTYGGNRRYVPIDIERSVEAGEQVLDVSNAYEQRYPDYFRADLKVTYALNKSNSSHQFFLAVDNITGYKNVYYKEFSVMTNTVRTNYQFGAFPYLAYRINF